MAFIKIQNPKIYQLLEYVSVIVGASMIGWVFNAFLLPNGIASGGISGLSTITYELFGWEPAFFQWAVNIPLFIAGIYILGKNFGIKTLIGTIIAPLSIFLTRNIDPITSDALLAALFGGVGVGIGLGIVFRGNGSTGGTDLIAQILHKYTGISQGMCMAFIDGVVVITAAFVFSLEQALYALIALFVTGRVINLIQLGVGNTKMALIITQKEEPVSKAITKDLNRGLTKLRGYGGYTDESKSVLMTVLDQTQFFKLKHIVRNIDPHAFVILVDASEVLGEGFKKS